jgi:hypothetical protein
MSQVERTIWVFGYGSLIWDPRPIQAIESREEGTLYGWHREWTWISEERHGAPTCSLQSEGKVNGVFYQLNPDTAQEDLARLDSGEGKGSLKVANDVPREGATTHFWALGNNLDGYADLTKLDASRLQKALAERALKTQKAGPDGLSASDYILNINRFDPDDPATGNVARHLPRPPLRLGDYLRYGYLLRIPILMGIALALLPIISLETKVQELLGNLFVLDGPSIGGTLLAAMMLALSILVVSRVVLLNGRARFGVQQGLTQDLVSRRTLLLFECLTIPMLIALVWSNGQGENGKFWERLGYAILGLVAAHVLGYVALFLAVLVSPRYGTPADERYPMPFRFLKDWLKWAYDYQGPERWKRLKNWLGLDDLGNRLWPAFRDGYFDPHSGLLYPGHWLCVTMLFLTAIVYAIIWGLGRAAIPAIGYLILLLILFNWILSELTFFLDRYRVPIVSVLIGLVILGSWTQKSDHYFTVQQGTGPTIPEPSAALRAPQRLVPDGAHRRGRVVLVATAGGGIQAAAWTAQVLNGLQRELHREFPQDRVSFADSIALISSVSGGAVGTMFFANQYRDDPNTAKRGFAMPDQDLDSIVSAAETPGLSDVGWALAYADVWRVFLPLAKQQRNRIVDRGWALEEGWRKSGDIQARLSEWRQGVAEGWRPALIFNSTIVETGEPMLLATTDIHPRKVSHRPDRKITDSDSEPDWRTLKDLFPHCPNCDVPVVTAVRLAASFPYVSPASQGEKDDEPFHLVDGGYYDNYGVYSLLEWLREALGTNESDAPDILIIQIRSFPEDAREKPKNRSWFYQTYAPLDTLMSVRTTGQLLRDRDALQHFFEEKLKDEDKEKESAKKTGNDKQNSIHVRAATFEFQGTNAPLSWQMNDAQKGEIPTKWNELVHGKAKKDPVDNEDEEDNGDWMEVRCFFHPEAGGCAEHLAKKKWPW